MEYGKTNEILKASLVKVVSNNIMFYNDIRIHRHRLRLSTHVSISLVVVDVIILFNSLQTL